MYKMICLGEIYKGEWWVLSEGSSIKGSPEDKQPAGPYIKGSAMISRWVTLAHYTRDAVMYSQGGLHSCGELVHKGLAIS